MSKEVNFNRTNYFKWSELVHTDTGLLNQVPSLTTDEGIEIVNNLGKLSYILSEIRDAFGEPICINSAFRTKEVNEKVGGAHNSLHMQGRAADIRPSFYPANDYYVRLAQLGTIIRDNNDYFKEVIYYQNFIHVAI